MTEEWKPSERAAAGVIVIVLMAASTAYFVRTVTDIHLDYRHADRMDRLVEKGCKAEEE